MIKIVIPIYKGKKFLPLINHMISVQTLQPTDVLVIETCYQNWFECREFCHENGWEWIGIEEGQFDHGATRNLGYENLSDDDIVVYITQDIVPMNANWLSELISPIITEKAVISYSRQYTDESASYSDKLSKRLNFSDVSILRTWDDVNHLGLKTFYCSNASLAVNVGWIRKAGGFPEKNIVSEDWIICKRILEHGGILAYSANSKIYHFHNFSYIEKFRRYYDLGISIHKSDLNSYSQNNNQYLGAILSEMIYLLRRLMLAELLDIFVDFSLRLIAGRVARYTEFYGKRINRLLSYQRQYWDV